MDEFRKSGKFQLFQQLCFRDSGIFCLKCQTCWSKQTPIRTNIFDPDFFLRKRECKLYGGKLSDFACLSSEKSSGQVLTHTTKSSLFRSEISKTYGSKSSQNFFLKEDMQNLTIFHHIIYTHVYAEKNLDQNFWFWLVFASTNMFDISKI